MEPRFDPHDSRTSFETWEDARNRYGRWEPLPASRATHTARQVWAVTIFVCALALALVPLIFEGAR